jgi:glycosyltransferase involved in cell wall biosynthesis
LKTSAYSVSVIVPIYNEVLLVEDSLRAISRFMEENFKDYEIVVIESGSTDGSSEICDRLSGLLPNINVIHEERKSGFGSALRLGYRTASKELIWLVVVDMPFPLDTINRALPLLNEYDCVFSYRDEDDRGPVKRLRSHLYNLLVKAILKVKVRHINSAFRVFKREAIQSLPLTSTGWTLDAEVLYEVTRRNIKYAEIPVSLRDRTMGTTTITFWDPFRMIYELIRIIRLKETVTDFEGQKET